MINYHLSVNGSDLYVEDDEDRQEVIEKAYDKGGLRTPGFMSLLGCFESCLMVYKDTKLAWTVKMPNVPIFVSRV